MGRDRSMHGWNWRRGPEAGALAGAAALARGVALPAHAARCPALPVWSRWGSSAALLTALLWLNGAVPVEAAFGYVRNLRVPPAQVTGGPHADFPVLVQFTGDPLLRTAPAGRISSPQAYDIQFRAADQVTILDHEVEFYDGGTGTLVAWVRLPVLQSLADNDFSMFYGDPSVTCARNNPGRVWNPGYRYVYHLGESAGDPVDSTSNAVAATVNPSLDPLATVARGALGRIGRALEFLTPPTAIGTLDIPDAARPTQLLLADGTLAANTPFTLEAWVLFNDLGPNNTFYGLVAKGRESNADWIGLYKIPVGGNGRFGRRDFVWAGGGDVVLNYQRRNVLGFSSDFAEDYSKSNWSVEFTWINRQPYENASQMDGISKPGTYNLTLSVDRPTFINFLNQSRTFFFNSQMFFQYVPGYKNSMSANGPWNFLFTFTTQTGYFQDRLLPSMTWVYDVQSNSGAVIPEIQYRITESFSATIGMALFWGRYQAKEYPLNPLSVDNQVGRGAYTSWVENGLAAVRQRDELYFNLRYTF